MIRYLGIIPTVVISLLLHRSDGGLPLTSSASDAEEPDSTAPTPEGVPYFSTRIAGGKSVHPGDIPYHLQLRYNNRYQCGAVLVLSPHGNQVVLTSAQCITKKSPSTSLLEVDKLTVVGGRTKFDGLHVVEQTRSITVIHRHPLWHRTYSLDYCDLAVLHLNAPFDTNRIVQPIPLTEREVSPTGLVFVSGWGYKGPDATLLSGDLQVSALEVVDWHRCKESYSWEITASVQEDMFCAGKYGSPTFQGACLGDTGGPATNVFNFTLYLVGIFDYGLPKCGNRYQPSVFMDLSHYLYWIKVRSKP